MTRALARAVVVIVALGATPAMADGKLAGPNRITINLGIPEVFGFGYGRTLGDGAWRVHADVGAIVLVETFTLHLQRLILQDGGLALGASIHGGVWYAPAIIGEDPESETTASAGARLFFEVGGNPFSFVLEGGAQYWARTDHGPVSRDASQLQISFALRLAWSWGTH